jgi:hypothetical protein
MPAAVDATTILSVARPKQFLDYQDSLTFRLFKKSRCRADSCSPAMASWRRVDVGVSQTKWFLGRIARPSLSNNAS